MDNLSVAIALPVFNEESRIYDYLEEIVEDFKLERFELGLIVVNDCSLDATKQEILRFLAAHPRTNLELLENDVNLGHGPSTTKGIKRAVDMGFEFVITTDGDAQIVADDIVSVARKLKRGAHVVEGVRISREPDKLRKLISLGAKISVFLLSRHWPKDANTPLRGYKLTALEGAISEKVQKLWVPNIYFSIYMRRHHEVHQIMVKWRVHTDRGGLGSTWSRNGLKRAFQLLRFSIISFVQMVKLGKGRKFGWW